MERNTGMRHVALERGDWQAVIDAHPHESHDPQEWLVYSIALQQRLIPGPDAAKKRQQVELAFIQAQKEGAPLGAIQAAQQQAVLLCLERALQLAGVEPNPEIAQQSELAASEARIYIFLLEKKWLQAVARLEELPAHLSACRSLRNLIRAAVLAAFCGTSPELAPTDYASVNQLREVKNVPVMEQWQEGLEVTARLEKATPLVLINNFSAARRQLASQPFWIAYGNVRSGSTMVFNLLRILANSLSGSAISAWEGDLVSPEKFFDLINESIGVNLGVLKIHRCHEAVNARLDSGEAKAILSHRDMKTACFSYWRMLNNPRSPFFKNKPELKLLGNFLETEIKSFQAKSQLKNILVVREVDLRHDTKETIDRITEFVGTKLADESLRHLEDFLSVDKLRKLAEANQDATNSTGHEQVTYLHPGHIAESTSEQQCADETKEYITHLIEANQSTLDESGYCRVI